MAFALPGFAIGLALEHAVLDERTRHSLSCWEATDVRFADNRCYRYYALSQPFSSRLRRHLDTSPLIHQMKHLAADKIVSCMIWPLYRSRLVNVYRGCCWRRRGSR